MRSNQRDILEQRVKFIAKRRNALVTELEELDVEAQEIVITLRVLDRYAIRLGGMSTRGKTNKEPEPEEEDEEEAETQPTVTVQPETALPAPETPAEPETQPSEAGPAENGIYKPLAEALDDHPVIKAVEEAAVIQVKPDVLDMLHPHPPLAQPEPFNIRKKVEPVDLRKQPWSDERRTKEMRRREVEETPPPKPGTKEPEPETIPPKDETLDKINAYLKEPEAARIDKRTTAYKQAQADAETNKARRDGTANVDHSANEPAPSWRGKPAEPSNVHSVTLGEETLSLAGTWLMQGSKMVKKLDRWEQAVIIVLMKNYPEQTLRVEIKNMVRDIDRVIGDLRAILALTPAKIETTHGGWKLCPRNRG